MFATNTANGRAHEAKAVELLTHYFRLAGVITHGDNAAKSSHRPNPGTEAPHPRTDMPDVMCTQCGNRKTWSNRKGSRLADQRCPCGGGFVRAIRMPDGSYARASSQRTIGRKMERCAICGKKRSAPGGGVRLSTDTAYRVQRWHPVAHEYREDTEVVAAGALVCWMHSPNYPVIIRG